MVIRRTHITNNVGFVTSRENELNTFPLIACVSMEPISLSLGQKFELEKRSRDINAITDVQQLQNLTKDLLLAWQHEIARSRAAVAEVLG